jgi:hypothetical protein
MACFWLSAQGTSSAFLRDDMIASHGVEVLRTDAAGTVTEHRAADPSFAMPFADELPQALDDCSGAECPLPGTRVQFRMKLDAKGRLEQIERYEAAGGC